MHDLIKQSLQNLQIKCVLVFRLRNSIFLLKVFAAILEDYSQLSRCDLDLVLRVWLAVIFCLDYCALLRNDVIEAFVSDWNGSVLIPVKKRRFSVLDRYHSD